MTSTSAAVSMQQSAPSSDANASATIDDVLNVGGVASNILSHFNYYTEKKILRLTSKAFKHAVDRTITRFNNYGHLNSALSLNVLLEAPWDLQSIKYDFSRPKDDDSPPTDSLARHLDRWKNLKHLTIMSPQPVDVYLLGSCAMERLTSLELYRPYFDADSAEHLAKAKWWPRIKELEVCAHPLEAQNRVAPLLVSLGKIKVEEWNEEEFGTGLFSCRAFPKLRYISYFNMADDDAAAFSQLQLPNLKVLHVYMSNEKNTCEDICKCKAPLSYLEIHDVCTLDMKLLHEAWANTLITLHLVDVFNLSCSMKGTFELPALKNLYICPYYDPKLGEDNLEIFTTRARLPELIFLSVQEEENNVINASQQRPCDISNLINARWCCQLQDLYVQLYEDEDDKLVELVRHGCFDNLRHLQLHAFNMAEETLPLLISAGHGRFRSLTHLDLLTGVHDDEILYEEIPYTTREWHEMLYNAWTSLEKAQQTT